MPKSLLIVESPTKAKTLQKYLGADIQVISCKGHIKDLPKNDLGADPDREGEAIAWHIAEVLGEKNHNFHRVLLLELTPKAIKAALAAPGKLDRPRYDSQQARRILDRLVGYQISPLLWQKVKTGSVSYTHLTLPTNREV